MVKYVEKNLQNPSANRKQGPAALNKKKQYNLDQIHRGVGLVCTSRNIKYFFFLYKKNLKNMRDPYLGV